MGAIGAKGVAMFIGTAQSIINQLGNLYGVPEEKILLGSCAEPPDTKECILYGNIVGMGEYSATTVWIRWNKEPEGKWVNDSYNLPPFYVFGCCNSLYRGVYHKMEEGTISSRNQKNGTGEMKGGEER